MTERHAAGKAPPFKTAVAACVKDGRYTPAHSILGSMRLPAVTTNYDTLYEAAVASSAMAEEERVQRLPWDAGKIARMPAGVSQLLKLHGCTRDPETIVLTRGDYMRCEDHLLAISRHLLAPSSSFSRHLLAPSSRLLTPSPAFPRLPTPSHAFSRLLTPSPAFSRLLTPSPAFATPLRYEDHRRALRGVLQQNLLVGELLIVGFSMTGAQSPPSSPKLPRSPQVSPCILHQNVLTVRVSASDENVHLIIDQVRQAMHGAGHTGTSGTSGNSTTRKDGFAMGTVVSLLENSMFRKLWDQVRHLPASRPPLTFSDLGKLWGQDFNVVSCGKAWGDQPAWVHDCLLDCIACGKILRTASASFVLNPSYKSLLTPAQRKIRDALAPLHALLSDAEVHESMSWNQVRISPHPPASPPASPTYLPQISHRSPTVDELKCTVDVRGGRSKRCSRILARPSSTGRTTRSTSSARARATCTAACVWRPCTCEGHSARGAAASRVALEIIISVRWIQAYGDHAASREELGMSEAGLVYSHAASREELQLGMSEASGQARARVWSEAGGHALARARAGGGAPACSRDDSALASGIIFG